jgi:hypothetical protein
MHNAKSEMAQTMPAKKPDDSKTTMVVKPGAPAGQEKVIRIPKEKLADYKSKGYIEAESYIPEQSTQPGGEKHYPQSILIKRKGEGLLAGKEIEKRIPARELPNYQKMGWSKVEEQAKNPYAIGMAAAMKATGDKPPLKKSTIVKAHDIAKSIEKKEEVQLEAVDLKLLKPGNYITVKSKEYVVDKIDGETVKASDINGDFKYFKMKDIEKVQSSYSLASEFKPEDGVNLSETEGSGGGMDALRAIKAKRQRLEQELQALNKDDPQYKEKKAAKQKEIEAQKEIMARKQREVFDSFDPSLDDLLDLYEGGFKDIDVRKGDLKLAKDKREQLKNKYNAIMANAMQGDENAIADQIQKLDMSIKKQEQELIDIMKKGKENQKNEAVDPERVANLNQKIAKMTTKMGELDMSKPESKTKEAILKSDITTAKLRLQDLMQKSASDMKKAVNEMNKAKQSYKSLKMSMKKEQEMNGKKKTLTDKPLTKIEVNPKIEG